MKHVLSVLALAAVSSAIAVPASATPADPTYRAVASGALESPPNASPGTSLVTIDLGGTEMLVDMPFRDLEGMTTEAHIHCCTSTAFTGVAAVIRSRNVQHVMHSVTAALMHPMDRGPARSAPVAAPAGHAYFEFEWLPSTFALTPQLNRPGFNGGSNS